MNQPLPFDNLLTDQNYGAPLMRVDNLTDVVPLSIGQDMRVDTSATNLGPSDSYVPIPAMQQPAFGQNTTAHGDMASCLFLNYLLIQNLPDFTRRDHEPQTVQQ